MSYVFSGVNTNNMKRRTREDEEAANKNRAAINNFLKLLPRDDDNNNNNGELETIHPADRLFQCKTCNRAFPSFQALGGHRASHKKPRLMVGDDVKKDQSVVSKPKSHECSICGLEFPIGQALGGHMRRHRSTVSETQATSELFLSSLQVPTVKKANGRRILYLDLNLSPLENDLNLDVRSGVLEKKSPPILKNFFL